MQYLLTQEEFNVFHNESTDELAEAEKRIRELEIMLKNIFQNSSEVRIHQAPDFSRAKAISFYLEGKFFTKEMGDLLRGRRGLKPETIDELINS